MAEPQKAYEADTGELDIDMGDHDAAEVEIDEPQREDQSDDGDDGSEHDDVMNRGTAGSHAADEQRDRGVVQGAEQRAAQVRY
jgi:hypothetical protein